MTSEYTFQFSPHFPEVEEKFEERNHCAHIYKHSLLELEGYKIFTMHLVTVQG